MAEVPARRDTRPALNVHFKPIASGDVVKDSDSSPLAALLNTSYNDAAVIEMEAAGVAQAAQHADVNLLVIRGISDRSDGNKASSDGGGGQLWAAQHAAAFAVGMIAAMPAPGWPVLKQAPALSWRTDLHQPYATELATLELHLVPVDASARLQVVRLQTLWDELVQLGRTRGLVGQAEAVEGQPSSNGAVAFVRAMRGSGNTGLAVLRTGQPYLGGAAQTRWRDRRDLRPGAHRHTPHRAARPAARRPSPAADADRPGRRDRARDAGHPRQGGHAALRRRHDQDERPARAHRGHGGGQRRRAAPRGRPGGRRVRGAPGPGIRRPAPMNASAGRPAADEVARAGGTDIPTRIARRSLTRSRHEFPAGCLRVRTASVPTRLHTSPLPYTDSPQAASSNILANIMLGIERA